MKKGLKFVLALTTLLATPVALTSCGDSEQKEVIDTALSQLSLPSTVEADFNLTVNGIGGTTITWTSNNDAIKIEGSKAVVTRSTDSDVSVKLTATATYDGVTDTREFTVTVKKYEFNYELSTVAEIKNAADDTKVYVKGVIGQMVPYSTGNGIFNSSCYIVDESGALYVYQATNLCESVEEGDEVIISGTKTTYYNAPQIKYPTLEMKLSSNKTVPLDAVIEGETCTTVLAKTDYIAGNIYKLTGTVGKISGDGWVSYKLTDAAGKYINIYWNSAKAGSYTEVPAFSWLDAYADKEVTCAFVINGSNSSGTWRGHILHIYE